MTPTGRWTPTNNYKWVVPEHICNSVLKVLGHVDVYPCATKRQNKYIKAKKIYDEKELAVTWGHKKGPVKLFMSPTLGDIKSFMLHFHKEFEHKFVDEAIILLPVGVITSQWFHDFGFFENQLCIFRGRIKFLSFEHDTAKSPVNGNVAIYCSWNNEHSAEFINEFEKYGVIL